MKILISCEDRIPEKTGWYFVALKSKYGENSDHFKRFDIDKGWLMSDSVKAYYSIIGWYEDES